MNTISFPTQYKKALLNGTKNTTIRIDEEIGKYKEGQIYSVKSYAERDWNVKITIIKIISTTFRELPKYKIPKNSIDSITRKHHPKARDRVEIIRFEIVSSPRAAPRNNDSISKQKSSSWEIFAV